MNAAHSMLSPLLVPVLVSLLAASVRAETVAPLITPEALRADLRLARRVIEESHPGSYRYESPGELAAAFERAERSADRPMGAWSFYRLVATAVASIRCAHTSVSLPETLQRDLDQTLPLLPLAVRVLDRRVYVLRDLTGPTAALAGAEILSIAGISTAKLLDTLDAALPRDGDVATSNAWRLSGLRFGTHLARVLGLRSPYALELRDRNGRAWRSTLGGRTRPALTDSLGSRYPQDVTPTRALDTDFLDGGTVARIALHRFSEQDSATLAALHQAVAAAFDSVRARGSRALILDLRGNGGGEDELGLALLSELVTRPFTYYDSLVINSRQFSFTRYIQSQDSLPPGFAVPRPDGKLAGVGHPNLGTHEPAANPFDGPLFVLIDGRSLSTTGEFLSNLQARRKATFIGEECAAAYGGNTSGFQLVVRLPNSGLRLFVPQMAYYMAAHALPLRRGIIPDVPVTPTIDDLLAGRDPAMARAVELAGRAVR